VCISRFLPSKWLISFVKNSISYIFDSPPNTLVAVIVTLGAHTLNVYEVGQVKQRVLASNVRTHPSADAALIRTKQPITYNAIIQPIRLPQLAERNQAYIGYYGTASGWGRTGKYNNP
jgi:hypothetical protein